MFVVRLQWVYVCASRRTPLATVLLLHDEVPTVTVGDDRIDAMHQ